MHRSQRDCFVITCEHGGNEVPASYVHLFRGETRALLKTHRGYDRGALELAREMADALSARLIFSTTTRLLVDLNRSIGHRTLFSNVSGEQSRTVKTEILQRHYFPYRLQVEAFVEDAVSRGFRIIHISSHSFTPVWNGLPRNADVGLLYDPRRSAERLFCRNWQRAIQRREPPCRLQVRLNYPYRGTADGLTVHLRRRFSEQSYAGIELEVNQRHTQRRRHWTTFRHCIVAALLATVRAEAAH